MTGSGGGHHSMGKLIAPTDHHRVYLHNKGCDERCCDHDGHPEANKCWPHVGPAEYRQMSAAAIPTAASHHLLRCLPWEELEKLTHVLYTD